MQLYNKVDTGKYSILIQGEIGVEINGYLVASAIKELNEREDIEEIELRINSLGGDVFQSYSILSEIENSKVKIKTVNVGVALSCAGWILAAGKERIAYDYTFAMVHDAYSSHGQLQDICTKSIAKILSNRTNKSIEDIRNLMAIETWVEGEDQVNFGLVDKCIKTGKKAKKTENAYELMNYYKHNTETMKTVSNKLGLQEDATEAEILKKITEIEAANKLQVTNLQAEIEQLKNDAIEAGKKEIEKAVDAAIEQGICTKEAREEMIKVGNTMGINSLKSIFASVKPAHVDITNITTGGSTANSKKYTDYTPSELRELKNTQPKVFDKLLDEWQNS